MKRVLFVCVENSNRSQMSEAFARMHGSHVLEAFSAGSRPSGVVNPRAIQAMREVGYDLTSHHSKSVDDLPEGTFDHVITMGCGDDCPLIPALKRDDWPLPDPRAMPPEEFNTVRDEVERRVKQLIEQMG
jgi:arsenate reductase (thioredoxin)